jgi:hypothetical protein
MGYLTVIVVLGLAGWCLTAVFRYLWSHHFNAKWWLIFALLVAIGIGVGAWAGTRLEYRPNQKTRILGFPVPLVVFVHEGENWTDFVPPTPVQYGAVAANVLAGVAVAVIPLAIVARIVGRRRTGRPEQLE